MATYTIAVDERTIEGKNIITFLQKNKKYVKFEIKNEFNKSNSITQNRKLSSIDKALEDIEEGRLTEIKDLKTYFRKYMK